jgi:D-alanyl-D-alanine carboxypeptidase/D-alanyl-D-alanine-endopeptidase (penicillin-binding protein 4)
VRALLRLLAPALFASLCLVPAPVAAADTDLKKSLDELIDGPDYKHASWGIHVVNAKTGETVFSRNPDAMLAPASVTKLFSCATALITLGPDFQFETTVHARGLPLNGTLRGDLILVASGDLTLGGRTKDGRIVFVDKDHTYANSGLMDAQLTDTNPLAGLEELAKQVKASGIKQIDGDVLVDDRLFARARGSGSGPDAITPILVNDNVIDVIVEPGEAVGDAAKVKTRPETSFFQADALVTTGPEKSQADIQVLMVGPNHFAVRGRIPKGAKPHVRIYPVEDPALFARALFIEALRREGVKANAAVLRPINPVLPERGSYDRYPKVAGFVSPPFREALEVTLKVSHNLYASTLPCLVAVATGGTTAEQGLRVQRKVLKELGVDTDAVSFGGGAGGAWADHTSARAAVQLLQGMSKRPEWKAYKAALPVLGVDGTLAETVPGSSPAKGKAFAKTGTLVWYDSVNDRQMLKSKALAGTMTTKDGTELHFAMIVNNVPLPKGVTSSREGKMLGKLCETLYESGK